MIHDRHKLWNAAKSSEGAQGESLSLGARVLAVAAALEAMTTDRPGQPGLTMVGAVEAIDEASGRRFDPLVVKAFDYYDIAYWEKLRAENPDSEER